MAIIDPTPEELENPETATCLFGDYSFLASAYLLESCHQEFIKKGTYGRGKSKIPKQISTPLIKAAKAINYPYLLFDYS